VVASLVVPEKLEVSCETAKDFWFPLGRLAAGGAALCFAAPVVAGAARWCLRAAVKADDEAELRSPASTTAWMPESLRCAECAGCESVLGTAIAAPPTVTAVAARATGEVEAAAIALLAIAAKVRR